MIAIRVVRSPSSVWLAKALNGLKPMTPIDKKRLLLQVITSALGRMRRVESRPLSTLYRREVAVYRTLLEEFVNVLLDARTPDEIAQALKTMGNTIDHLLPQKRMKGALLS